VYQSSNPLDFGVEDDSRLLCALLVAAPEVFEREGKW